MANNIKGITVDIGGNVGPLASALQEVNTPISKLQSELKEVNRQLKFDPSNATLLKQKQDLLAQSADALKEKQAVLKKAVADAQAQFEKGDLGADKVRAVEREYQKVTSQLKDVQKQQADVGTSVGSLGSRIKSAFSGMGQSIKSAFTWDNVKAGIGAVGVAVGAFLKGSIDEAKDAQKANADLAQTLKSTGGASGMTMESLNALTEAMMKNTAFSDDEIKSGEGMLLTFTNIGKNVFPQATAALLDMSQKMGTDTKTQAVQLGKALNDPVNGITALTRVGVTFTDQQKNQIAQMVKVGDTAGAQKVILSELNKEFGGQAAAAADTFEGKQKQLDNTMKDVRETIGTALMPMLTKLLQAAMPIIQTVAKFVTDHPQLTMAILAIVAVVGTLIGGLSLLTTVTGAFGITLDVALLPTIGLVVLAIAGIAVAAVAIVTHWKQVSGFFIGLWNGIKAVFAGIGNWFASVFNGAANGVKAAWNGVTGFFSGLWNGVKAVFMVVGTWFAGIFGGAVDGIKTAFNAVIGFFQGVWDGIVAIFNVVKDWFVGVFTDAWNGIQNVWNAVVGFFKNIWNGIVNIFNVCVSFYGGLFRDAWNAIVTVWNAVVGFFQGVWNGIVGVFSVVSGWFGNIFSGAVSAIQSVWSGITGFFSGVWNGITGVFGAIGSWFSNKFNEAKNAITSIFRPDMLTNIGHQLIEGLWNGINNAVGWILGKLNGFKDAVLNGLKSLFGIHSPSTLFRDEIGKNLALGIGEGFTGSMQSVASKMKNVSQGLTSSIYGSVQSNIGTASYSALNSGYSPAVAMAGGGYYSSNVTTTANKRLDYSEMLGEIMDGISSISSSSNNSPINLTVKVGESTLVDRVIKGINQKQRASGKTLITV